MKFISLLLTYLIFINTALAGLPPTTASGLSDSTKTTTFNFKVPNNQSTKITGATLLETGNQNILKDPSLEGANNSSAWVFTGGTLTIDNTPIHGLINGQIDTSATSLSMTQSSTLYQAQFADGVQGLASMRVRVPSSITTPIYLCSIQNGVEGSTSSGCVQVQANGKWGLYKVPFILGGTSNGIALTSKGVSFTNSVEWDDAFLGAVDLKQDVDQSRIAGESYFAGTTGCEWTRTNAAYGALGVDADCPGPTIVTSTIGVWATTDSDLPRQTITNLPAGVYKATFHVNNFVSVNANTGFSINDGTTTCEGVGANSTQTAPIGTTVSCTFTYTSSGNRTFELYAASASSTVNVRNGVTSPRISLKFQLEYFGSGSVYSSTNADTDWASCGHTTADFTGFGTVTNIETQCKRQGGDLLMRGKFTNGTTTAVEARLNLKLGGTALTSAGVSKISSISRAGGASVSFTEAGSYNTLMAPNLGYINFSKQTAGAVGNSAANGNSFATGSTLSFDARIPIAGWENSNIIIGTFNGIESCTDSYECTDTFSAQVSSAGVVSGENLDWISGNCTSTSPYVCTFKTSLFSVTPNCTLTGATSGDSRGWDIFASSSASLSVQSAANVSTAFSIICQKSGGDYIGKTAKAVASDQNLRTPSVTNAVFLSAEVSSAGVVSQEDSDFINGSCAVTDTSLYTCTWNTSYWASAPKCIPNVTNGSQNFKAEKEAIPTTSSGVFRTANSTTGAKAASGFTLMCHGAKL